MRITKHQDPDTKIMVGQCQYCASKAEALCDDPELEPGLDVMREPFAHAKCPVCGVKPPGGMFFRKKNYSESIL